MCFSVKVDVDIKKLSRLFSAKINSKAYQQFNSLKVLEDKWGLIETEKKLGLRRHPKRKAPLFKTPSEDYRIYSNYFTNVITQKDGERFLEPMRYRVRPNGSAKEIPTKYNVFNARIDSLEKRQTWEPLFMNNHGLFPFTQFFEWVENPKTKKPTLINFRPDNHEIMWAPCLYDEWISKDGTITFKSFALITDDPPPEIAEKGHDRCPIFLKEDYIDEWLNPKGKTKDEIYTLLKQIEKTKFQYEWAS